MILPRSPYILSWSGYKCPKRSSNPDVSLITLLPIARNVASSLKLAAHGQHRCVRRNDVECFAHGRSLQGPAKRRAHVLLNMLWRFTSVLQPQREVIRPAAARRKRRGCASELLKISVPNPGHILTVGGAVIEEHQQALGT